MQAWPFIEPGRVSPVLGSSRRRGPVRYPLLQSRRGEIIEHTLAWVTVPASPYVAAKPRDLHCLGDRQPASRSSHALRGLANVLTETRRALNTCESGRMVGLVGTDDMVDGQPNHGLGSLAGSKRVGRANAQVGSSLRRSRTATHT